MNGKVIVCESAVVHRDGMFDITRGGISILRLKALPISLEASALAYYVGDPGDHVHELRCLTPAGGVMWTSGLGGCRMKEAERVCAFIFPFRSKFTSTGIHRVCLLVDGTEVDCWPIHVEQ